MSGDLDVAQDLRTDGLDAERAISDPFFDYMLQRYYYSPSKAREPDHAEQA